MPYAIQRSTDSGATFSQDQITTADITLSDGSIANTFYTIKDSKDNSYVTCYGIGIGAYAKIIRVDSDGNKAVANFGNATYSKPKPGSLTPILLSRDENTLFLVDGGHGAVWTIPSNFENGVTQTSNFQSSCQWYSPGYSAAFYQDRYIWVASGATIKIYNYETKAELASVVVPTINGGSIWWVSCSDENILYVVHQSPNTSILSDGTLSKITFNGINTLTRVYCNGVPDPIPPISRTKQMLIDKWGDLIIITNTGTASTLLKYSTAGVKIGDTITLSGAMYNLNTDKDGNYYYSNALGTWKIPKNTAQGQAIAPLNQHVKIRDNGMTTFGNNISGYNPAVFS